VYDIIITENNYEKKCQVKKYLKEKFKIKDLSKLKYFLEIEIALYQRSFYLPKKVYPRLANENQKVRV
jgi:hypothetical protein